MKWLTITIFAASVLYASLVYPFQGRSSRKIQEQNVPADKVTGVISWTSLDGQTHSGSFKYLGPDKIYVKFTSPRRRYWYQRHHPLDIQYRQQDVRGPGALQGHDSGALPGL